MTNGQIFSWAPIQSGNGERWTHETLSGQLAIKVSKTIRIKEPRNCFRASSKGSRVPLFPAARNEVPYACAASPIRRALKANLRCPVGAWIRASVLGT